MRNMVPDLGHPMQPPAQVFLSVLRSLRKKGMMLVMTKKPQTPGEAVRVLRAEAGLTIEQVAAAAGVSPSQISRVETGAKKPSQAWLSVVIEAIAQHLKPAA